MIELRKATRKAVKYACLHFHYAKSVPVVSYAYNVYENGNGAELSFLAPAQQSILRKCLIAFKAKF